jgi:predicted ATPase/transcriptional regulator with XRE-family HTH domain
MPSSEPAIPLESFLTFGDLLKYLRRRARLTQRELSIAVGYSEAQVSRLEQNQRPPDISALTAVFIPALYLEDEPLIVTRLMELAAQARGESLPQSGMITFSRSVRREVRESVRTVEENVLNNLPLQLTSFIGREHEMIAIMNFLGPENKNRLITLTGSGGCGKTRLALQVANQLTRVYRDGVWLIELAPISNPAHVAQTVITALGMSEPREGSMTAGITNYLKTRHILLLVDNCEHVVSETSKLIHEILLACPHVQVLATSREILNIQGEVRFRVSSLSLSESEPLDDDLRAHSESVQLFVERAQSAFPTFRLNNDNVFAIAQVCRRLDGMPLAIELAAARVNMLSIEQIVERLDNSFQLLAGGWNNLLHHQTLDAAIQWSYDLLSDRERVFLHRLSVFAGGWALDAAESVASDPSFIYDENVLDLLSQLVNKSLVVVDFQARGETRYHLLETVREYSHKRLIKSGEHQQIEKQHFDFFLSLAEKAEAGFMSADHQSWLKRLDLEQDNLRIALDYGLSAKRYEDTLQFAGTLFWFWQTLGYISEGRSHLEKILAGMPLVLPADQPSAIAARAKALWCAGGLSWIQGDYTEASSQLKESIALWRQLGGTHKLGLAISLRDAGIVATYQGELDYALSALQESIQLLQESRSKWNLALAFYNQGLIYEVKGDTATARAIYEESLSLFRALNEPWGLSVALNGLGRIAGRQGDYDNARPPLEEALSLSRALGDLWSSAASSYLLGEVSYLQQDMELAAGFLAETLRLNQTVGDRLMIGFALHAVGRIANQQGNTKRALCLFAAAKLLRGDMSDTASWSLANHAECEQDIIDIRANVEKASFELAWNEGQTMSIDEAIGYALTSSRLINSAS